MAVEIQPLAYLQTCFGEKFAVPRQPGLCPSAWGRLVFEPGFRDVDAVRGLKGFSHVWLIFGFHQVGQVKWTPMVRPPRLGGNDKVGVFASRSTHRPNGLGLSLVALERIELDSEESPVLHLGGVDLVDGTPIYDVKPYLPYAESPPSADGGYAAEEPERLPVRGVEYLSDFNERDRQLVVEALSLDPRPPAGRDETDREFGAWLCGRNVRFKVDESGVVITRVDPPSSNS